MKHLIWVLLVFGFVSCQKETSFENSDTPSDGSVQADLTGNCLGITVAGTYQKDTTLAAANFVDLTVTVLTPGSYKITTDTVNGYSFNASGVFTAAGTSTVRLQGVGKPLLAGTNNFTVTYDSTECFFSVTVTAAGGGTGTAVYSFEGSPGGCTNAVLQGTYVENVALTAANKVAIQVNVTTIGTYAITTSTQNGFAFTGLGNFTTTGVQTVELTASGLPMNAGTFTFTLTAGTTTCTFPVTCDAGAPTAFDYFPRTANSNWSYEWTNDANDTMLTKANVNSITIGGNTYKAILFTGDQNFGFDTLGYFRKAGGNYHVWMDVGDFFGLDDPQWADYIFLKDDQPLNHSWTTAAYTGDYTDLGGNTFPVTVRFKYTIQNKDVSVSITTSTGTVNYQNVIEIKEDYEQFDGTNWVHVPTAGYRHILYARNIGIIKEQYYTDALATDGDYELRRYIIN